MKRLRQDLDHLTSAALLVAALVTGATGLIADLWDLNDFWYHTLAGYVMGGLAVAHVLFNWRTLVAYARFRLVRRPRAGTPANAPALRAAGVGARSPSARPISARPAADGPGAPARGAPAEGATGPAGALARIAVSRRGLLGAGLGGVVGLALGRGLRTAPPIPHGSDVGVIYHEWSKPGLLDALGTVANWGGSVPLYKTYPGAVRVPLGNPDLTGGLSTSEAIAARRSTRTYSSTPLSLPELSRLLHLAGGISADRWGNARRTAPSSGALYPVEIYPVVHNVAGLERGVYHYAVQEHALELVATGDYRTRVVEQGLMQEFLGQCGAVLFLTQILQRMRPRYQDRSYRYGLVEIGHIGQNVYLAATSAGLGACGIGAFMDDDINTMLGVDGVEEAAVYMLAVGRVPATA